MNNHREWGKFYFFVDSCSSGFFPLKKHSALGRHDFLFYSLYPSPLFSFLCLQTYSLDSSTISHFHSSLLLSLYATQGNCTRTLIMSIYLCCNIEAKKYTEWKKKSIFEAQTLFKLADEKEKSENILFLLLLLLLQLLVCAMLLLFALLLFFAVSSSSSSTVFSLFPIFLYSSASLN